MSEHSTITASRQAATTHDHTVDVELPLGGRVRAAAHGVGATSVLLLGAGPHAGLDSWSEDHATNGDEWTASFRNVLVDHRWSAGSTSEPIAFDYSLVAADHLAALDALGLEAVSVLGVGTGAAEALALAKAAPDRVDALCLIDPPIVATPEQWQAVAAPFDEPMRVLRAGGFDGAIEAAVADPTATAAGPFGPLLNADPAFREQVRTLGRERYVARLVAFRDGMYPSGTPLLGIDQQAASTLRAPIRIVLTHDDAAAELVLTESLPSASISTASSPWSAAASFLNDPHA